MPPAADAKVRTPRAAAAADQGTVHRVTRLLTSVVDHPNESAGALAVRVGLPRSTTHRLLALLRDGGFVDDGVDGGYTAGAELFRLAGRLIADVPYQRLAQPLLQALTARFDETALLTLLARGPLKMFYGAAAAPADPMRYDMELNRLESLAWGATGRSLLAWLDDAEIDAVVARNEPAPVGGRPLEPAELIRSLRAIRSDGYAMTHSHRTRQAIGIAVPFFAADGEVVGNVALLVPSFRFDEARLPAIVEALRDGADRMSRVLGHEGGASRSRV